MQVSAPIGPVEFDRLMQALGPFESAPYIAAGVSGGADSMALALLLVPWVAARGGRFLTVTVDHGLRPDSRSEAEQVAAWMAQRGIAHRILSWHGPKPATGVQAGARHARLRLLADAAAEAGILHLALAHHADDQAETHRLRADRSSGPQGLAGMPAIREMERVRLVRPLLPVAKDRLIATCVAAGQAWVEDPSNRNPAFARARLRLSESVGESDKQAVNAAAAVRVGEDVETARLLALHARFQPEGWAILDHALFQQERRMAQRLAATLLRAVGGAPYPPAPAAVADLVAGLRAEPGKGRTLAGCQFTPIAGGWRLIREARNLQGPVTLQGGGPPVIWDGRFRLWAEGFGQYTVRALDEALWRKAVAQSPSLTRYDLPAAVRWTLPVIVDGDRPLAIPPMGWVTPVAADPGVHMVPLVSVPAVPARFAVVTAIDDII